VSQLLRPSRVIGGRNGCSGLSRTVLSVVAGAVLRVFQVQLPKACVAHLVQPPVPGDNMVMIREDVGCLPSSLGLCNSMFGEPKERTGQADLQQSAGPSRRAGSEPS
jgi:hypothetical protein